jgi:nicotinate-nucleotide adenylyltransferase
MNRKIGLLGGTFNPIHNGHLELGKRILDYFQLDKILYILSANPPHKPKYEIVPSQIRWKMLSEALKPYKQHNPCDIEMHSPLPSWTINTIDKLSKRYPGSKLYFISGSDGFLQIQSWKDYQKLIKKVSFIILLREDNHFKLIQKLAFTENLRISNNKNDFTGIYIYRYPSETLSISSTRIRSLIKSGKPVDRFLPEKVKKIIKEYKLYEI